MTMTQGRVQRRENRPARRVEAAEQVKSGAAQRAYAKRRSRESAPALPRVGAGEPVLAGRIPFVATILALLGCGLAFTLLLTTRATEDSYELGAARRVNQQLSDERDALARDVAAADSAPELASRARELGMIPARDPARLVIGPNGEVIVVGDPTPAAGSPAPPLNTLPPSPGTPPPNLSQAQGERVVPVTTTPAAPPAANQNPAIQAAPQPPAASPNQQPPAAPVNEGTPQPPAAPADQPEPQQVPPAPEAAPQLAPQDSVAPAPHEAQEPPQAPLPVAPNPVQATSAPALQGVPR
ncbi:hypothetical protein [Nocardia sp. CC227C]|uniref:hypothetical protein n=1 Tax=Nocardia sp. CC227C TaxID=3044562 RepID=UPI00278BBC73|nr:hypothetical protein [Nocardia sp. CC227C]